MKKLRLIFYGIVGILSAFPGCQSADDQLGPVDLDQIPEYLPYITNIDSSLTRNSRTDLDGNCVAADINGDGIDEFIMTHQHGLICYSVGTPDIDRDVHWQYNLGLELLNPESIVRFQCVSDLDGDGCDEAILTARPSLGEKWRLIIHDSADNSASREFELPDDMDYWEDGAWDGSYFAIGVIENAGGRGRPGIVLTCEVAYDGYGRGVLAIDPDTGDLIWRYRVAVNPARMAHWIGDLDGDTEQEVIFAGTSPTNFSQDGRQINGLSDDRACVFALSHRGELKWYHQFGSDHYLPRLQVGDLDGDGNPEAVISTCHTSAGEEYADSLLVLSGRDGQRQAWTETSSGIYGLTIAPATSTHGASLYCGSRNGYLRQYRYEGEDLILERIAKSELGVHVATVGDLIPERRGEEILLITNGDVDLVLDEEFNILSTTKVGFPINLNVLRSWIWQQPEHEPELVLASDKARTICWFTENERWIPWKTIATLGLAALGTLSAVWYRRRFGRRKKWMLERDVLFSLFKQLRDIGHGDFNALGSLKALQNRFQHGSESEAVRDTFLPLIQNSFRDYQTNGRSALEKILETATYLELDMDAIESTRAAIDETNTILELMCHDDFSHAVIVAQGERFSRAFGQIHHQLDCLRAQVDDAFTASMVEITSQMLKLYRPQLEDNNVMVQFIEAGKTTEPPNSLGQCVIDSMELRFILENLIGNACKAMLTTESNILTISIERNGERVKAMVTDSGVGIPSENQQKIFIGGLAGSGSGTGLIRSRELVGKWYGTLRLIRSEPGKGSTFVLELPGPSEPPRVRS
jgi:signal transduction histidine kinase/outer membrane protein assembly factor BamB